VSLSSEPSAQTISGLAQTALAGHRRACVCHLHNVHPKWKAPLHYRHRCARQPSSVSRDQPAQRGRNFAWQIRLAHQHRCTDVRLPCRKTQCALAVPPYSQHPGPSGSESHPRSFSIGQQCGGYRQVRTQRGAAAISRTCHTAVAGAKAKHHAALHCPIHGGAE
jgi:hypothetical protein